MKRSTDPRTGSGPGPARPRWLLLLLLRAYPAEFRASWDQDLMSFWESQSTEPRYRGVVGKGRFLASLALHALADGIRLRFNPIQTPEPTRARGSGTRKRVPVSSSTLSDVRYAFRSLRGAPLFSLVVMVTLALGIGATASVFSVVERVVLRPLPFPDSHELVAIPRTVEEGKTRTHSWPDFRDYREQASGFSGLTAYYETEGTFEWQGGAESLDGAGVAREFFDVMGVPLLIGRTFSEEEDRAGGPKAVILSYGLWRSRFDADEGVLGTTVSINGEQIPVIGITPEGFSFPRESQAFWMPLRDDELLAEVGLPTGGRTLHFLQVIGRVDPAVGLEGAETRFRTLARNIDEASGKPEEIYTSPRLTPLQESLVGDADVTLLLLLAAAGLVLVVACANVAGLSFSRATMRMRELAVRAAIGADRSRLLRQLLTESLLLSMGAGLLGIGLAKALQSGLIRLAPESLPNLAGLGFNPATLGFVGLVTLISGLLFGFFPALKASKADVAAGLAGGRGTSSAPSALRPQQVLVSFQVSLAVVLLVGATLLSTSLLRLSSVDRGFEAESVLVATIDPETGTYDSPARVDAFYRKLLDHVRSFPGVVAASTTYSPPLTDNDFWTTVASEGADPEAGDPPEVGMVIVRDGYFESNGIPLMQGRDFGPQDQLGQPPVAIVNEAMAELLWPGENPLGKRFAFAGGMRGSAESFDDAFFPDNYYTVVGVAGDIRRTDLASPPGPEYYRPHSQITWAFQYLIVRTSGDPAALAADLRSIVWEVDPTVPVKTVEMLSTTVRDAVAIERFRVFLIVGFAGITCILAMVGLYAVMALIVARRSKEIGIRLAMGARKETILRGMLSSGLTLVGIGIVMGVSASLVGGGLLSTMLYEIRPTDPVAYLVVVTLVSVVAVAASLVPAMRAAGVDPIQTLKEE